MCRLNLVAILLVVLTACGHPIAPPIPTATAQPAIILPPTPITPTTAPSIAPTSAPTIVRTIVPVATPAASIVYTSTDAIFTLKIPANWVKQSGQRQLLTNQSQHLAYVSFNAPGTLPQPAIIIFYDWPAVDAISNDTAWQQAYALASLAIKDCAMNLSSNTAAPIDIAGEHAQFIGYTDPCGQQGELIGLVHGSLNVGILIEAPQPVWAAWQPLLRNVLASLKFKE